MNIKQGYRSRGMRKNSMVGKKATTSDLKKILLVMRGKPRAGFNITELRERTGVALDRLRNGLGFLCGEKFVLKKRFSYHRQYSNATYIYFLKGTWKGR